MLFALLLRGKLHRSIMSLFLYGLPGWMQASFARRRRPRAPLKRVCGCRVTAGPLGTLMTPQTTKMYVACSRDPVRPCLCATGRATRERADAQGSMNMYGINGSACDASLGRNCEDPDDSTFRAWQNGLT